MSDTTSTAHDTTDPTCERCGRAVSEWPWVSMPRPDGSMSTFHEECSPWADKVARSLSGGLELLSDEELAAAVAVVVALVEHDDDELRRVGALGEGRDDPYEPTRRWREWPAVELVVPPGDPRLWEAYVTGSPEDGWTVDVRMWTVQEQGPSELVLHLDVAGRDVAYRGLWS